MRKHASVDSCNLAGQEQKTLQMEAYRFWIAFFLMDHKREERVNTRMVRVLLASAVAVLSQNILKNAEQS